MTFTINPDLIETNDVEITSNASGETVITDKASGETVSLSSTGLSTRAVDTDELGLINQGVVYHRTHDGDHTTPYPIADYADIGDAVNAAMTDNRVGEVILPPGAYTYSTDITPTTNAHIRGAGRRWNRGTHLTYEGTGSAINDANKVNFALRDFSLEGPGSASGTNGILQQKRLIVENIEVKNFERGVRTPSGESVWNSAYRFCNFSSNGHGLYLLGAANQVNIVGCIITTNDNAGIRAFKWNALNIIGNSIESNNRGIRFLNNQTSVAETAVVSGNYFESNGTNSITIDTGPNGEEIQGITITDNRFREKNASPLIDIDGLTKYVTLRMNRMGPDGQAAAGVSATSSVENLKIKDVGLITVSNPLGNVSATRTIIEGLGTNDGDPSAGGEWNGNGYEGVIVRDTTNANTYIYNNGAWSQIASE